jgi:hypothetical protein
MNENSDSMSLIRTHLQKQSPEYLIDLLVDIVQAVDEPFRQRFWDRLAPPAMATAVLRYTSPEVFLTELQEFEEAVMEGEFFDEEALEYFGEDPFDREYNRDKYGLYEDFDPDMHDGLNQLGEFLTETDSYFQAKQFDVAAQAYEIIIGIIDQSPDETIGIYDPLSELGEMEEPLAQRYFTALQESCPTNEFYNKAIHYLALHDQPHRKHMDNFMTLVGANGQEKICAFLEGWADTVIEHNHAQPLAVGIPFQLRLLIHLYQETNQSHEVQTLQKRFRHIYLAFYEPLLAEREAAKDWQTVINYGQEVLTALPDKPSIPLYPRRFERVDADLVRKQMAHAYETLGDVVKALGIAHPLFERHKSFEHYAIVRRLATTVNAQEGQAFMTQVIAELQDQLPQSLFFLCQVFLHENQFDAAYTFVAQQDRYNSLEAIKLVAKAHLLAGFGQDPQPYMGPYLQDLYSKIEQSDHGAILFLRLHLPATPDLARKTAVSHAETLYRNVMQIHINNGRRTYATAAYYCALLGEIATYDGRKAEFEAFYQDLLNRYPRHRALRRELDAKVTTGSTQ